MLLIFTKWLLVRLVSVVYFFQSLGVIQCILVTEELIAGVLGRL